MPLTDEQTKSREELKMLFIGIIRKGIETSGTLEVIFCLLRVSLPRVLGMERSNWDTYEEFVTSMKDFDELFALTQGDERKSANFRLAFLAYCHVVESDPPYVVLANLLRCAIGKKFHINPFGHLQAKIVKRNKKQWERDNIFDPKAPPLPVKMKFEYLCELADEAGFPQLTTHLKEIYDPDVRNAFIHANYVFDDKFKYFINEVPHEMPWEETLTKISLSFAFMQVLIGMIKSHLHHFYKMGRYHKLPNYEVLEMVSRDEELVGFYLHFSNGSKATFVRNADGSYELCNLWPQSDGTLNFNCGLINALRKEYLIDGRPFDQVIY